MGYSASSGSLNSGKAGLKQQRQDDHQDCAAQQHCIITGFQANKQVAAQSII